MLGSVCPNNATDVWLVGWIWPPIVAFTPEGLVGNVASQVVVISCMVIASGLAIVCDRPNNCHIVGLLGRHRKMFANPYARGSGIDRSERSPKLDRRVGFHVPSIYVRCTPTEEKQYTRLRRLSARIQRTGGSRHHWWTKPQPRNSSSRGNQEVSSVHSEYFAVNS